MSKADKMFEKLGYIKLSDDYYENGDISITFNADETIVKEECHSCINAYVSKTITMQELQAINEKCKELGWLDE
jgi:hypothetical protein